MTSIQNDRHSSLREDDPWWKSAVVYHVYPRSFLDTNGDGLGDIRGIIEKLDYLATLGIDVLWFSPVYPSPQVDNGYDVSNYKDVDPRFGTLDDLDELIAKAREYGIRIMMDIPANHTSDIHPWFIESRSSKDNPKRDWYWWRPAREGMQPGTPGAEPTNGKNGAGTPIWTLDEATGEYYLHLFTNRQPDLNWENPEVRAAIHDVMRWWIDRGVYGFRLDVINHISKVLPLRDDNHLSDIIRGPRVHEFLQEAREEVAPGEERFLSVGEMPGVSVDEALIYTDPDEKAVDMVFKTEHLKVDRVEGKHDIHDLSLPTLKRVLAKWQQRLHGVGWNALYWNSHDHPRAVSRFGNDTEYRVESAKLLATVLHMMQGTPYIYQGEELGMTNYPFTRLDQFVDVESRQHIESVLAQPDNDEDQLLRKMARASRMNARTPMQWDDSNHAGFTTGEPWMPVNPNAGTVNAKHAVMDEGSVFHYYRKLIELRHELPIIVHGRFDLLLEEDERIFAYTRTMETEQLLVVANFGGDEIEVPLDDAETWAARDLLLGNYPDALNGNRLTLRPWEARVYHRN